MMRWLWLRYQSLRPCCVDAAVAQSAPPPPPGALTTDREVFFLAWPFGVMALDCFPLADLNE